MLSALMRAFTDLSAPQVRRFAVLGIALALASFAALWVAIAILLGGTVLFDWAPLEWLTDILGGVAVLALSWLFGPAVVTSVMGVVLDRIAGAVAALH